MHFLLKATFDPVFGLIFLDDSNTLAEVKVY